MGQAVTGALALLRKEEGQGHCPWGTPEKTGILLLDLRKAFDSVSHDELLWRLGITGFLGKWFRANRSDQQQF